jgi:hypothetical protein
MGALEIAALIAMLAGTAVQYKTSTDATKRANDVAMNSMLRNSDLQQQAEKKAMDTAKTFNADDRIKEQGQIEQQLTQQFAAPAAEAQAINSAQATTQGDVSKDYTAAKAKSDIQQMNSLHALAQLMGKTTAAGRLRTNEAVRVADAAGGVDRLGSFARNNAAVDDLAMRNAARPDANDQLVGGLLSAAGSAGLAYGGSARSAGGTGVGATASTSGSASAPIAGSTTGSYGFQPTGATGFKTKSLPAIFGANYQ